MQDLFRHHQLNVYGQALHLVEAGSKLAPPLLFLHGWPESWETFREIMIELHDRAHVLALDLPGIGRSEAAPPRGDKRTLANYVRNVIAQMNLKDVTLIGHDVGGQITYAYLKSFPGELGAAVIMNVAIPGVDPWARVKANPHIWHFGLHAVPNLPEAIVSGRETIYFDYFYDTISASPAAISHSKRAAYVGAYSRPESLHAGFEWYRAFAQDEQDNAATKDVAVTTPVLYLRGDKEGGQIEQYAAGLREHNFSNVHTRLIEACGHFSPDEQPRPVAAVVSEFLATKAMRNPP